MDKNVLEVLELERWKHSREFKADFMKDWNDDKKEQFYKKNEKVFTALEYAIKCVAGIDSFKMVVGDLQNILNDKNL